MGSDFISSIETNLIDNPVPLNIYPGGEGENLPVETEITIDFVSNLNINLTEIQITSNQSNIKTFSVEYKDSSDNDVFNKKNEIITLNKNGILIINKEYMPNKSIKYIKIKIIELIDNTKNASVTISIKGCFGKIFKILFF